MAEEFKNSHTGVYPYNRRIRNQHLERNLTYPMLWAGHVAGIGTFDSATPVVGGIYDPYIRTLDADEAMHRLDKDGILKYTIENQEYYREPEDIEVFVTPVAPSDFLRPNRGKYNDYTEYINSIGYDGVWKEIISKLATWEQGMNDISDLVSITKPGSTLNDILKNFTHVGDIRLAMEVNKVGIVRHYSVHEALNDIITTNVNNFSHTDTELGKITNELYAKTLQYASYFNTARNTHYISDYLQGYYGTNAYTIRDLTYRLYVSQETGRMLDIDNNEYIKELSIFRGGDFTSLLDYQDSVDGMEDHWPAYNRYQNIYLNGLELPSLYKEEHVLYNPFDVYADLTNGKSVDHASIDENSYTVFGINTRGNDKVYHAYNEGDFKDADAQIIEGNIVDNSTFVDISDVALFDPDNLLNKTNRLFKERKIGSLVGRFHTSTDTDATDKKISSTQTAISKYGMSHGRNLLTKKGWTSSSGDLVNDYDNPYCRVWTYHHQYHRLRDAIRPFLSDEGAPMGVGQLQENWGRKLRTSKAGERLENFGVMNNNGLVNIAPTKGTSGVDIRNCMFSIENLAWKDVNKSFAMNDCDMVLSPEQTGPNGGRIMWFPPYNLTFSENISAEWNRESFIGRGEDILTYKNTKRSGQLDFTILVDHPGIVDSWRKGKANPTEDDEQELLRFFAGCNVLQPSDTGSTGVMRGPFGMDNDGDDSNGVNKYGIEDIVISDLTNLGNGDDGTVTDPTIPQDFAPDPEQVVSKEIVYYVFFPNNYSGEDDRPDDALRYLLFGKDYNLNPDYTNSGYEMGATPTATGISSYTGSPDSQVNKWWYRVDNRFIGQRLFGAGNYYDTASSGLNSTYEAVIAGPGFDSATCSFAEFYGATNINDKDLINALTIKGANMDRMQELNRILSTGTIKHVEIYGGASTHGYTKQNTTNLAPHRAQTLKKWMSTFLTDKSFEIEITKTHEVSVGSSVNNVSGYEAKAGRYARVAILCQAPEASTQQESTDTTKSERRVNEYLNEAIGLRADGVNTDNLSATQLKNSVQAGKMGTKNWLQTLTKSVTNMYSNKSQNGYRYDYEKEYFSQLSVNDPVMHKRIVDKIKYFDPAFHSITPEGFNARLTFLHQCTRQGHTISSMDKNGWSTAAGNLAFGRPPICVLRLGDFFNTKIAIESINITYDDSGIQWDMNPEGIGLQPMMAKVSMTITFLGGSDIAAPVSRLQNAVSFNYYANTSLYDNRSDVTQYNSQTEQSEFISQWTPQPNATKRK